MIRGRNMSDIRQTAEQGFAAQEAELAAARQRQVNHVVTKSATGSGSINENMELDRQFRLIYVRCHFTGGTGGAAFTVSVGSAKGTAYDCQLLKRNNKGTGFDVFETIAISNADPSPWTIDTGDSVNIKWTNPDSGNMTWGLECGFALAS
jgi:hypothetical protein